MSNLKFTAKLLQQSPSTKRSGRYGGFKVFYISQGGWCRVSSFFAVSKEPVGPKPKKPGQING
jgi:hypothetical protein